MSRHDLTKLSFLFFVFVVSIRQITLFATVTLFSEWIQHLIHVLTAILFTVTSILLVRATRNSFKEYGFSIPQDLKGGVIASLLLAVTYMLVTVFLPGSFSGFESLPPDSPLNFGSYFLNNLLIYLAIESVFRGYIQTNFTRIYGFSTALCASAIMSTVYNFSFLTYIRLDTTTILYTLSLFLEGILLGFFFHSSKTLFCPILFGATASTLYLFTPLVVTAPDSTIILFKIIAYIVLVPLVQILVARRTKLLMR